MDTGKQRTLKITLQAGNELLLITLPATVPVNTKTANPASNTVKEKGTRKHLSKEEFNRRFFLVTELISKGYTSRKAFEKAGFNYQSITYIIKKATGMMARDWIKQTREGKQLNSNYNNK